MRPWKQKHHLNQVYGKGLTNILEINTLQRWICAVRIGDTSYIFPHKKPLRSYLLRTIAHPQSPARSGKWACLPQRPCFSMHWSPHMYIIFKAWTNDFVLYVKSKATRLENLNVSNVTFEVLSWCFCPRNIQIYREQVLCGWWIIGAKGNQLGLGKNRAVQ